LKQPLLIYGNYPSGTLAALVNGAAGQVAADVLQANEDTFVSPAATTLTLTLDLLTPMAYACIALAGEQLNGVLLSLNGSTDNFAASNVPLVASSPLTGFTAAWRPYTSAAYRYLHITLTGATTATRLYHLAFSPMTLFPFLADGADLEAFVTAANHIISPQGHFLGSQKTKTERKISLSWGQVTEQEYLLFDEWAVSCVRSPQAFFLVPDSDLTTVHFGYTEPAYTFSAPMKNGLRSIARIPFTSRFA